MTALFLPFRIEDTAFLVPLSRVREILGQQALTRIPHATRSLPGVFAHNGVAIPLLQLSHALQLRELNANPGESSTSPAAVRGNTERPRTIVASFGDEIVAFGADEVWEVVRVEDQDLREVHVSRTPFAAAEVQWSGGVATVLDLDALMEHCLDGGLSS